MIIKRNVLLNPGPSTTTDSVKMAQVVPDICPREKSFGDLMSSVSHDLVKIAKGGKDYTAVLFGCSGTGVVEAMIGSVVAPDKWLLVINNGAYGKRIADIAGHLNLKYFELKFPWDQPISLNVVKRELKKRKYSYISFVHHETTTGQLNQLRKLTELSKKYKCTTIIDAISSFVGLPINVKKDQIDFMASTANKCLQGMAGLSFVICNKRELEKVKEHKTKSYYFDLYSQYEYFVREHQMRFTPPVQTAYALRQALDELFEEGIKNRQNRYRDNWLTLYDGLKQMGFSCLLPKEYQSGILTTIYEPADKNFDFTTFHDLLFQVGFTIYPGKLDDNQKTFRIANMGAIDSHDISLFLKTAKRMLQEMGVKNFKNGI